MRHLNNTSYSVVSIDEVNKLAKSNPKELVEKSEEYYSTQLNQVVDIIKNSGGAYKIILLCGPSGSGKTTTAHKLKTRLVKKEVDASVISMDDFFLGVKNYPLRPNGKPDMETVATMDLDLLNSCMKNLLEDGCADFPVFDFEKQARSDKTQRITLKENGVIIMEGIHALNPIIMEGILHDHVFRMYISVRTKFVEGEEEILRPNEIRLIRRMIRDYLFRDYSAIHTMEYWNHVLQGERINIDPYRDDVDFKMDTTIDYEVCCWHGLLHDRLDEFIVEAVGEYPQMEGIIEGLLKFVELDVDLIPVKSLLREFIGSSN